MSNELGPYQDLWVQTVFKGYHRTLVKSALQKNNFPISQSNICCGYSNEPSHLDGNFVHPKHMLKIIGKKIFTILH